MRIEIMDLDILKNKHFIRVTFYIIIITINGFLYNQIKEYDSDWWRILILSVVAGVVLTLLIYLLYKMIEALNSTSEILKVLYSDKLNHKK
jgi:putative effector of murein hydrolase